ncbi:hypothetical protein [Chryseobacterium sp.]|uniref:hypothetical protein n=1 Tax=Chryseobacterium sp. TaxID=1871047 RepID=UPI0028979F53|nr:hypothetical protein [Chryseobacterium sp.]
MKVLITPEMREAAKNEALKRDKFIRHHFEVGHLSPMERDVVGFLGEFARVSLIKTDWKANIRENYFTIDDYDVVINELKIDIKTETVPRISALKIIDKTIHDNELYGRRLINKNQLAFLDKYDWIFFGLFIREEMDYWYPIGIIDTKTIIRDYPATIFRPDGKRYPFPGSPIPTSILQDYKTLI